MAKDIVMLKYTDQHGSRLAALCRPSEGAALARTLMGDEAVDEELPAGDAASVVAIATDGTVNVTSSEDLTLLSFWFATAANWLKTHGG